VVITEGFRPVLSIRYKHLLPRLQAAAAGAAKRTNQRTGTFTCVRTCLRSFGDERTTPLAALGRGVRWSPSSSHGQRTEKQRVACNDRSATAYSQQQSTAGCNMVDDEKGGRVLHLQLRSIRPSVRPKRQQAPPPEIPTFPSIATPLGRLAHKLSVPNSTVSWFHGCCCNSNPYFQPLAKQQPPPRRQQQLIRWMR
jgi:hypothetical protein